MRQLICLMAGLAACATPLPRAAQPQAVPPPAAAAAQPSAKASPGTPAMTAPQTRRVPFTERVFGVQIDDPYRWLENGQDPEVKAWMLEQNQVTRARLDAAPERAALVKRLSELYYVDTMSAPERRGNGLFYRKREAGKEKASVYVSEGGKERLLLDPSSWTKDGSDALGGYWPSWDGKRLAFTIRRNNSDESTLYMLDVASGERSSADVIPGAKYGSASWTPSGDGFYYTWIPPQDAAPVADRPGLQTIKFHRLGDDPGKDTVIAGPLGDPKTFQNASLSKDGHWLVRDVRHGWRSNDLWFRRADARQWTPLAVGQDALYTVEIHKDRFYLKTNEGAPRSRVFVVNPAHPERTAWKEIVPERKDAALEDLNLVGGRLALLYLKDVVPHIELHELDGRLAREVPLPALGSATNLQGDADDDDAYFAFQSVTIAPEISRVSVKSGASEIYFRTRVPVDPSRFAIEEQFTTSKDGTRIPLFVVHRKDLKLDGTAPAILTGYGGFLVSNQPTFQAGFIPWLEQGGVYALAILRGGGEYGEDWHRAGMLERKQNVFDDFIAAAEHLVKTRVTQPARLAIYGRSNGGLLVGAAETQRPDLFGAVLCGVPLLDMVRYHLFGSGKTWSSEYGTAEDPQQFKNLYAYSPYQHLKPGTKYPATLVFSADSDDRVDPMHARKFTAALQADSTGGPVIYRLQKNSGHGGADLIKETIQLTADELVFARQSLVPTP